MDVDDLTPRRKPLLDELVREDLSTLSADELDERIDVLKTEIGRTEVERAGKKSSRQAAESFFKS